MVKISRIYTRTGDDGSTGLLGNVRVHKESPRVTAYGDLDELNAAIGSVRTALRTTPVQGLDEKLEFLQQRIFDVGAILAAPPGQSHASLPSLSTGDITRLEHWIDELVNGLPVLQSFVLPGGDEINSRLHIARTICRRAERSVLTLHRIEPLPAELLQFINRASDLLFAMARHAAHAQGAIEYLWLPGKKSDTSLS
ncbi:MAG: cob(I)yrinic acid a,c-diamide adenosyltransferase [Bdellovibrionota bacterium]|nr:MAG: cob(I)yrinic acid a,c-diamide adenosyltransferase [Bdellovibrionota bacterium]